MSGENCPSKLARRFGSAACDLPGGHDGLHVQCHSGITWTTEQGIESWLGDDA